MSHYSQDYFNIVSIVCIEKKISVQSAIEYVFVMLESVVHCWSDLRTQIPKFDPQTDGIVSIYFEGLEYFIGPLKFSSVCVIIHIIWTKKQNSSGLAHWHWEAARYLGPQECRAEVKNTLIKVLSLESGSPQLPPDIRYNA